MSTCATCRHWHPPGAWDEIGAGMGRCSRLLVDDLASLYEAEMFSTGDEKPPTDQSRAIERMAVIAGTNSAYLCTRPDFGCTLWGDKA